MKIDITIDEYVGRQCKKARKARGFTQEEFSKKLGISHMGLSKLENGTRPWKASMLIKVAIKLKYPLTYFYQPNPTQ